VDPPVAPKAEKPRPAGDPAPGEPAANPSPNPNPPAAVAGAAPRRFVEAGHAAGARRRPNPARRAHPARRHTPAAPRHHARRTPDALVTPAHRPEHRRSPAAGGLTRKLSELSKAAVRTANRFSFPLGLAILVIAFLAIQGRIDRRDPKLRLAPVDSKHDLLSFS
jgi:hypothetical protein